MGWSVRADVNIEWTDGITEQELKDFIAKERMDEVGLHGYHDRTTEQALAEGDVGCNGVDFSLWGNKGVNYDCLDAIKEFLKENVVEDFEITANEYAETGNGYYYDRNEDEENE